MQNLFCAQLTTNAQAALLSGAEGALGFIACDAVCYTMV
jgi:hypothetical protein